MMESMAEQSKATHTQHIGGKKYLPKLASGEWEHAERFRSSAAAILSRATGGGLQAAPKIDQWLKRFPCFHFTHITFWVPHGRAARLGSQLCGRSWRSGCSQILSRHLYKFLGFIV
jgi:hypothetical protein